MNCFVEKKMKSASGHPVEATPQVVLYACCWVIGLCMSGEAILHWSGKFWEQDHP